MNKLIKNILFISIILLTLCGCSDTISIKTDDNVLNAVSKDTMDKIMIFTGDEEKEAILNCYTLIEKGTSGFDIPELVNQKVYVINDNVDKEQLISLLKEPLVIADRLKQSGFNSKVGLTECQDVFSMVRTDNELLNKSINAALEDVDLEESYLLALSNEYILLGIKD